MRPIRQRWAYAVKPLPGDDSDGVRYGGDTPIWARNDRTGAAALDCPLSLRRGSRDYGD